MAAATGPVIEGEGKGDGEGDGEGDDDGRHMTSGICATGLAVCLGRVAASMAAMPSNYRKPYDKLITIIVVNSGKHCGARAEHGTRLRTVAITSCESRKQHEMTMEMHPIQWYIRNEGKLELSQQLIKLKAFRRICSDSSTMSVNPFFHGSHTALTGPAAAALPTITVRSRSLLCFDRSIVISGTL